MNEKKWDNDDFWDNEPEEEDEYGSDLDAYNDETFDNAAKWDEDEHEQMIARDPLLSNSNKGSGWNPFGSKDLFTSPEQGQPRPKGYGREPEAFVRPNNGGFQQHLHQQLYNQRQYRDSIQTREPPKHYALFARVAEPMQKPVAPQAPKWITVEELERQMIPTKSTNLSQQREVPAPRPDSTNHTNNLINQKSQFDNGSKTRRIHDRRSDFRNHHDHNKSERSQAFSEGRDIPNNRTAMGNGQSYLQRAIRRYYSPIIPPQVQLSVIENARRLYSITAMHPDEFIQDRMPTSEEGLMFKRHSEMAARKPNHDGVLTQKERHWLTRIQEKIQADYDDNLDEDYYYLLYFNRSSMKNEASQKPVGPGVLDRRFIPRERLLYN